MKFSQLIYLVPALLMAFAFAACAQQTTTKKTSDNAQTPGNMDQKIVKTEAEWRAQLSKEQYYVLREKGTERPYTGALLMTKEKGIYKCAGCGNELFTDEMKFDSHCGWPSFDREIAGGKITTVEDNSHGMRRTEITCARCGGHLGHIFEDGPTETGMRYCVNSLSLEFVAEKDLKKDAPSPAGNIEMITLGGGCYWCVEAVYQLLDGVVKVESGFAGGHVKNPTYRQVCTGETGHAEVVQITFDNTKTSVDEILKVFFTVHDPTTLNRQGADQGTQYRSVIYYHNEAQKQAAQQIIADLNNEKAYANPIVTEVAPLDVFYKAEDYHQDYYNQNPNNGYCRMVIQPKVEKFEKVFANRLKKK